MNAPLSEVPPHQPKKRDFAKAPFPSLSVICALQVVTTFCHPVFNTPIVGISQFWHWTYQGVVVLLNLLLISCLWRGYGLARAIVLWLSFFALSTPFYPNPTVHLSSAQQIVRDFDFALSLFLLVYLNLPAVKAHFARRKSVKSN